MLSLQRKEKERSFPSDTILQIVNYNVFTTLRKLSFKSYILSFTKYTLKTTFKYTVRVWTIIPSRKVM